MSSQGPRRSRGARVWRAFLALVILIVIFVACVAIWMVVLPLPKTTGTIRVAGLSASVDVERDAEGIPHIHAQSLDDLYFAQGYVTAQDRLWQMELLRRVAQGDLGEFAGARALPLDIESRTLGIRVAAEAAVGKLPAAEHRYISAYARGVNAFITTHSATLPVEYKILALKVRPWTEADSLAIGLHMFRNLTTTWKDELLKSLMLQRIGPARTAELLPTTTVYDHPPALEENPLKAELEDLPGIEPLGDAQRGSNNWVVAPAHSASGKAMLANDPHLEYSVPGIWYTAQLSGPAMNVAGVTLPGLPGVVIGHNEKIAWGLTNFGADVQDLYLEAFDPSGRRYLVDGQWKDAEVRKEIIKVHNAADYELNVVVTRHGPLIVNKPGERYALRWVATEPGVWRFPFIVINAAQNWQEFTAALRDYPGPTQNFVYADSSGNIGYYGAGLIPIRPKGDGNLPLRGDEMSNDWKGYIPFDQLPHVYNPPSGMIATANAKVVPENYPYIVATRWDTPDRTNRIYDLLHLAKKLTPDDFRRIQVDVYSGPHHRFAKAVAASASLELRDHPNARLLAAAESLRNWDGVASVDSYAASIAHYAREEFQLKLLRPVLNDIYPRYDWRMRGVFLERVIAERPASWLPQEYTDYDQLLADCLNTAMGALEQRFKSPRMEDWRWGKVMETTFTHPIGNSLPLVKRLFNLGPFETPGTSFTVKQTTHTLGPSMRLVVDFADLEKTTLTTTTGESGHQLSSHYRDQFAKWKAGEGVPLSFAISAPGREKLVLIP